MTERYHVVCHTCDFERVVDDDRVLAAAVENLHQRLTDEVHDVEYDDVGEVPADG
jgi:hypothetical protein